MVNFRKDIAEVSAGLAGAGRMLELLEKEGHLKKCDQRLKTIIESISKSLGTASKGHHKVVEVLLIERKMDYADMIDKIV